MCAHRVTTAFRGLSQESILGSTGFRILTGPISASKTGIWCDATGASASEMGSWLGYEAFISVCCCRALDCALVAYPGGAIQPLQLRPGRTSRVIKTTGWLSRFHAQAHQSSRRKLWRVSE